MVMYRTAVVGGPFWPLTYVLLQATIKHSWVTLPSTWQQGFISLVNYHSVLMLFPDIIGLLRNNDFFYLNLFFDICFLVLI